MIHHEKYEKVTKLFSILRFLLSSVINALEESLYIYGISYISRLYI